MVYDYGWCNDIWVEGFIEGEGKLCSCEPELITLLVAHFS